VTGITHKKIVRRQLSGIFASDSDIPRLRNHFQHLLETSMRDEGIVPHLDIDQGFSVEYLEGRWSFLLTIYGIRIGREGAAECQGLTNGKLVPRYIRQGT